MTMIAILNAMIGLIPVILGFSMLKLYGRSRLTMIILMCMISIGLWQLNHACLFVDNHILDEEAALYIYRLTRIGLILYVPFVLELSYFAYKENRTTIKNKHIIKLLNVLLNKVTIISLYVWSIFVYIINWTNYELTSLTTTTSKFLSITYYIPLRDGPLQNVYLFHVLLYLIVTSIALIVINKLENTHIKKFLNTFLISTVILYFSGLGNFIPHSGFLISTIAVILVSIITMLSYIQMYKNILESYHKIKERQSKLDYVGNLSSSLIHEVKNALTIIQGYSALMPEVVEVDEKSKKILSQIKMASNQLSDIVTNYNKFLKNDKMDFKNEDIIKVVKSSIELMEEIATQNKVTITCNSKEQSINTSINSSSFIQVLLNLMKNSIEAIPQEREIKSISINISASQDVVFIDIFDTGSGIPKSNWNEVFYAFNSTKENGNGLGLIFCKKIILEHRGNIQIIDSDEKGTHIQIKIPRFKYNELINDKSIEYILDNINI